MRTFIWYILKMIQIIGLLSVLSALYYGFRDNDMMYELKMFIYGGALFYGANWLNNKYIQ